MGCKRSGCVGLPWSPPAEGSRCSGTPPTAPHHCPELVYSPMALDGHLSSPQLKVNQAKENTGCFRWAHGFWIMLLVEAVGRKLSLPPLLPESASLHRSVLLLLNMPLQAMGLNPAAAARHVCVAICEYVCVCAYIHSMQGDDLCSLKALCAQWNSNILP